MSEVITLFVNGATVTVPEDSTVAAAIVISGATLFRRSVIGEPRGPLCGMGICFECRVTIDGQTNQKSCQILCERGMQVRADD